ncbi:MAG: hypothetical protein AAF628_12905 [Planctomycetota bacterium]
MFVLVAAPLTALAACGGASAPSEPPTDTTAIVLRHKFSEGEARRYRCEMRTRHMELAPGTKTSAVADAAASPSVADLLALAPKIEGVAGCEDSAVQDVVVLEEELCHGVDAERADVSYRCVSCEVDTYRDGTSIYSYDTREALREMSVFSSARGKLNELFEPIRYLIDSEMRIHSVSLPDSLSYSDKAVVESSYRKALESRYQSFFPAQAVKPGDTWSGTVPINEGMAPAALKLADLDYVVTARHAGYEKRAERWCAVIDVEMRLGEADGVALRADTHLKLCVDTLLGTSRIWFDYTEGMPVLEESRLHIGFRREFVQTPGVPSRPARVEQLIRTAWVDPAAAD